MPAEKSPETESYKNHSRLLKYSTQGLNTIEFGIQYSVFLKGNGPVWNVSAILIIDIRARHLFLRMAYLLLDIAWPFG